MASEDRKSKINMYQEKKDLTTEFHGVSRSLSYNSLSSLRVTPCPPWSILILFLLFLSCQTIPKTADAFLKNANSLPLEAGASVYIIADVKKARPIIDILPIEELKDKQTKQMLDKTAFLAAALFSRESGKRFQLAAFGNYPSSQADFALSVSSGWQKQRSQTGGSYWYSQANRLSIALDRRQAFIASSLKNDPYDPLTPPPGKEIPEGFQEFRNNSPLSFWLENPAPVVNRILSNAAVPLRSPIQGLFVNLLPSTEKRHEALIRLQFENPSHARGMAALLNLASGFASNELSKIFFANPPVQNGSGIDLKTAPLGETEIALFFSLFQIF